ncbi:MAG: carnitine 3-dehydrogenase [Arenicella sp.]
MKKTAAIIGGGTIGGGWAARFLIMGWDVVIYDPADGAEEVFQDMLANARRSLPGLSDVMLPDEGHLLFSSSLKEAVEHADWIQESVPERLELKHDVFSQIQSCCREEAIIASSTSGFRPTQLQENSIRPQQIIVAHPFNPVYLIPLVELVGAVEVVQVAKDLLTGIGMRPLHVRKEIDAHIADRLLEAVWREGLWLVNDGVATTQEIDDAISYGFGLRWAQMGLFETYRIAGGKAGMVHFISQFGPALKWPWTKLMDVPELTQELIQKISDQSDAQSGQYSIRELERIRDKNLVGIMRSLKNGDWAVGELLNAFDDHLTSTENIDISQPILTIKRSVPMDWTDYNGHMNESRYGQVFSDAADVIMKIIGADGAYVNTGLSYFTVNTNIQFINECEAGDVIEVITRIQEGKGKKLRLYHEMRHAKGDLAATADQLLIHVDLKTRKSCEPMPDIVKRMSQIAQAHALLPETDHL